MKNLNYLHIKIKAGRINIDRFRQIIKTLIRFQVEKIAIGEQQTLYFAYKENKQEIINAIQSLNFRFQTEENHNLVSSIAAVDILATTNWIHSGVYAKIIQTFPKIKPLSVRITDPAQRLVSLFGSQINFVASEYLNFWYLYLRNLDGTYFLWPVMINSNSLGEIYQAICDLLSNNQIIEKKTLVNKINELNNSISIRSYMISPVIDQMEFPYYDGFHFNGNNYWFGFSSANGYFKTTELDSFCVLLEKINVKEIYLNLRGGFILKSIEPKDINLLNQWIKQSTFKMGRSFNELGWQYDGLNQNEHKLKEKFTRELSKRGNENYGFSIKLIENSKLNLAELDTDYIISYSSLFTNYSFLDKYRLWIKQSINPADGIYKQVGKEQSFAEVSENLYSKLLANSKFELNIQSNLEIDILNLSKNSNKKEEYICLECDTAYLKEFGDENQGIKPGTSFDSLPEEYKCFVCGAEKNQFSPLLV